MIKKQIKNKNETIRFVEMSIQDASISTSWAIDKRFVNRLIRKVKELPVYNSGIPKFIEENSNHDSGKERDSIILCFRNLILMRENNVIEIRADCDFSIENEILKSAPDNIYKQVSHLL